MFRTTVIRRGKWRDNLYTEDKTWGDFPSIEKALAWATEESKEFRGGWKVESILVEKVAGDITV